MKRDLKMLRIYTCEKYPIPILLRADQVATILHVDRPTVRDLIKKRVLKAYNFGQSNRVTDVRISLEHLNDFISHVRSMTSETQHELFTSLGA